jgi:hypothetical protein
MAPENTAPVVFWALSAVQLPVLLLLCHYLYPDQHSYLMAAVVAIVGHWAGFL